MKVLLITQPMPASAFIAAIHARAPELELVEYRSGLNDAELADVDVVLGWQMPPGLPARVPRVGWVCSVAAGVEKLLAPDLAPQVRVSRIVDREQAAGIAQFVVMMALRHARDLERYEVQQRERDWSRQPSRWRATGSPYSAPARWAARSPPGSSAAAWSFAAGTGARPRASRRCSRRARSSSARCRSPTRPKASSTPGRSR